MTWETVEGQLVRGHQVASGLATDSPYKAGTIALQTPHFDKLGLDLTQYFSGTLNISIAPKRFSILKASHTFANLKWHQDFAPETFSFCPCQIQHRNKSYSALIYYPHPETKLGHFQDDHTVEVIAPHVTDLHYGDHLVLQVRPQEVAIK